MYLPTTAAREEGLASMARVFVTLAGPVSTVPHLSCPTQCILTAPTTARSMVRAITSLTRNTSVTMALAYAMLASTVPTVRLTGVHSNVPATALHMVRVLTKHASAIRDGMAMIATSNGCRHTGCAQ